MLNLFTHLPAIDSNSISPFNPSTDYSERKFSLRHYRFFSLIGLITLPAYYYVMRTSDTNAVDFISLRLILAGICLIALIASFTSSFVKSYMDEITLFVTVLISVHGVFLLVINNFHNEYLSDFYFTSIICCLAVKRKINLAIFLVITFTTYCAVTLVYVSIEDSLFSLISIFVLYIIAYFVLSHIKSLEKEINEGGKLMETLFGESPDAILFVERMSDKIMNVNHKTFHLLGVRDKKELIGKSLNEVIKYNYERNFRTGHEIKITNSQGEDTWIDIAWQKIVINNKDYSIVRLMDINEKKKAEAELIARDELLHGVAGASGVLLMKNDFANAIKSAMQMIGIASGADRIFIYDNSTDSGNNDLLFNHRFEWIRKDNSFRVNRMRLQHLSYREYFPNWVNDLMRGKTVKGKVESFLQEERTVFQTKGAQSVMVIPIMIDERFQGFMGFEYSRENHVWNYNEENTLKTVVTVISGAISRNKAEQELLEAKQAAEDSSKAKESFLANVSHEIRTPMNGILGLTHLLQKSKIDEKQTQYINAIKQSSEHLLVIINDLLDFSKIVAGAIEFEKIEFELGGILYNISQTYGNRALEKGIQLKIEVGDAVPNKLVGDPVRLNQILVNLIGNAIKFTEEGFVALRINNIRSDKKEVRLGFIVEDTGIGIPEDKLDTIFESFKQASSETTRKYGGTGLGLGIVKKLLDAQNGKIQVTSFPGEGSCFTFDLVFENEKEISKIPVSTDEKYHSLKNARILLAEDNVVNQLLAYDLISSWGATIDIADNGEIAVSKLRQEEYDLVLMDVQMPVMNGLEATEIIRKESNSSLSRIPIIAMTANAIKGDNEKYLSIGMNDCITKPFNAIDLNKKIWQYLTPEQRSKAEHHSQMESKTETVKQEFISAIIDLSNLKEFSRGKSDFILKMLSLLQEQTPGAVETIGAGIKSSDWETVRAMAHKIKPNISLLGSPDMDALILKIEKNAESQNRQSEMPEYYKRFIELLIPAMEEVTRAIAHYKTNS